MLCCFLSFLLNLELKDNPVISTFLLDVSEKIQLLYSGLMQPLEDLYDDVRDFFKLEKVKA